MAELLFIATIIFVAYVVFVVMGDKKDKPEASKAATVPPQAVKAEIPAANPTSPPAAVKATPAATKTTTTKTAPAKVSPAKAAVAASPASDTLKNPKTGEIAKFPNSYAFAKRWIKDALVEEGLLDKVYKNNELNEEATAKIHDALHALRSMDKYQ